MVELKTQKCSSTNSTAGQYCTVQYSMTFCFSDQKRNERPVPPNVGGYRRLSNRGLSKWKEVIEHTRLGYLRLQERTALKQKRCVDSVRRLFVEKRMVEIDHPVLTAGATSFERLLVGMRPRNSPASNRSKQEKLSKNGTQGAKNYQHRSRSFPGDSTGAALSLSSLELVDLRGLVATPACTGLLVLSLRGNRLAEIEPLRCCPRLIHLDLSSNLITNLLDGDFWGLFPELLVLLMHENKASADASTSLKRVTHDGVTFVRIHPQRITRTACDFQPQ